jgi:glutaredoxin
VKESPLNKGKIALAKAQAGDYDRAAAQAKLDALIAGGAGGVTVFSFSTCPFCVKAKATLDALGAKYTAIELDQLPNKEGLQLRAELAERTERTSMPSIWIKGACVGGCNDGSPGLLPLQREGKLEPLLREAGSLA